MAKLKRRGKRIREYLQAIDVPDSYWCSFDELLGRERLRAIHIGGVEVTVRTSTPDLRVAIHSLFDKEYDAIRCPDPKTILDAGANIGTSAIFFARKYPNAKILAVEPEAGNFELLQKNVRNYKNVIPVKAAIWGSPGMRMVQNRFTGSWGFTVSETHKKSQATGQEVECVTIPSLMKEYGMERIDLLKMDIEGGEKDVLENAADWIDRVGVMTVELHDRICMGCDRAFYLATKDFVRFEKSYDKVTAYRSSDA